MLTPRTRTRVLSGAALTIAAALTAAGPAYAALSSPQAEAYVVQADALAGLAAVAPTPESVYPDGGTETVLGVDAGPFATDSTLTATTAGDPSAGTSSASATVDSLGVDLGLATASLTGVEATCDATPTGATGSGTIAGGTVTIAGIPTTLQADAPPNTGITLAGLGSVVLNEQSTDADGVLTVNAVHFTLLPALGGADVIIGHAQCGGAEPATAVSAVNPKVAGVAGGLAAAAVLGVAYQRRRSSLADRPTR